MGKPRGKKKQKFFFLERWKHLQGCVICWTRLRVMRVPLPPPLCSYAPGARCVWGCVCGCVGVGVGVSVCLLRVMVVPPRLSAHMRTARDVCVCVCVCLWVCVRVYVYQCMCLRLCISYVYIHKCVYILLHNSRRAPCFSAHARPARCLCVCVCVCVWGCVYVYIYVCVYICMYIHLIHL